MNNNKNIFKIDKNPAGGFTVFSDINGVKDWGIYKTTKSAAIKEHAAALGVNLDSVRVVDMSASAWGF